MTDGEESLLHEPHGVIHQKSFFIITVVKTFQKTAFFGPTYILVDTAEGDVDVWYTADLLSFLSTMVALSLLWRRQISCFQRPDDGHETSKHVSLYNVIN
jgi:hypothetical protein